MKKFVFIFIMLLMAASCIDGSSYVKGVISASFEYSVDYNEAFGADSVFFDANEGIGLGWQGLLVFFHKVDNKQFKGGFQLSYLKPSGLEEKPEDYVVNPFRVAGPKTISNTYAVFNQTEDMPERDIRFIEANGTCKPTVCWVNNTEATYAALKEKFGPDNELKLVAQGYLKGEPAGKAEIKLAADTIMYNWTKFDISALGSIDAVDFSLECDGPSVPMYFCLDEFTADVEITY